MKIYITTLLALLLVGSLLHTRQTTAVVTPVKALRFGKLADGTGKVIPNAVVVVEGDRIKSVGSGQSAVPSGAEVIDLTRYAAIPALIDAHTHMTYYWDQAPGTQPWS